MLEKNSHCLFPQLIVFIPLFSSISFVYFNEILKLIWTKIVENLIIVASMSRHSRTVFFFFFFLCLHYTCAYMLSMRMRREHKIVRALFHSYWKIWWTCTPPRYCCRYCLKGVEARENKPRLKSSLVILLFENAFPFHGA